MTISNIRTALAERLATVALPDGSSLRAGDLMRVAVNPPMALVGVDDPFILPHFTMGGSDSRVVNFKVYLFLSRTSERTAQDTLNVLLDAESIEAAIEADWPQTGVADFAEAHQVGEVGELAVGDIAYFGCVYSVMVVVS